MTDAPKKRMKAQPKGMIFALISEPGASSELWAPWRTGASSHRLGERGTHAAFHDRREIVDIKQVAGVPASEKPFRGKLGYRL